MPRIAAAEETTPQSTAVCRYGCKSQDADRRESSEEHERLHAPHHIIIMFNILTQLRAWTLQNIRNLAGRITSLEQQSTQKAAGATPTYSKDSSDVARAGPESSAVTVTPEFQAEVKKNTQIMMEKTKVSHNLFSVLFKEVQQAASRVVRVENHMAIIARDRDGHLQELKRALGEGITSYNGVLLWTLEGVSRLVEAARSGEKPSILSPAFYTSRGGYKLCARIYLHGDGIGRGTFLSLFIVIMKGKYDGIVTWPFQQVVTLTLLDQSGRGQHVKDSFRADPTSTSFRRPRSEMNIASGCPRFLSLTDLRAAWANYVCDDRMMVEVKVDTAGLDNFGGH